MPVHVLESRPTPRGLRARLGGASAAHRSDGDGVSADAAIGGAAAYGGGGWHKHQEE